MSSSTSIVVYASHRATPHTDCNALASSSMQLRSLALHWHWSRGWKQFMQ